MRVSSGKTKVCCIIVGKMVCSASYVYMAGNHHLEFLVPLKLVFFWGFFCKMVKLETEIQDSHCGLLYLIVNVLPLPVVVRLPLLPLN